jgi:hypothetical protein
MAAEWRIDDELAAFLVRSSNSMIVATRNKALEPHAVRACGIDVLGPTRVTVLVPKATGAPSISDLEHSPDIAIVVCRVTDYRTVQLKGRCVEVADASPDDVARSQEQLRLFADGIKHFGFTRQQARNYWLFDLWRVTVEVTSGYQQTPGPGAGAPLGGRRGG